MKPFVYSVDKPLYIYKTYDLRNCVATSELVAVIISEDVNKWDSEKFSEETLWKQ